MGADVDVGVGVLDELGSEGPSVWSGGRLGLFECDESPLTLRSRRGRGWSCTSCLGPRSCQYLSDSCSVFRQDDGGDPCTRDAIPGMLIA